jgi:dihydrofolate reductase
MSNRKRERELVVPGSASVVDTLIEHDLVDEYRLLVFPLLLAQGRGLFPDGTKPSTFTSGAPTR